MKAAIGHVVAVVVFAAAVAPVPVLAQVKAELAGCEQLNGAATREWVDLCLPHTGCKMTLNAHKTCAGAKTFVDNLALAIGQGTKTLFGHRKEVTPDAVFEAVITPKGRVLDTLPETREVVAGIRKHIRDNPGEPSSGQMTDGESWVEYVEIRDGKADGAGVLFFSSGVLLRGGWKGNGWVDQVNVESDYRAVGERVNGKRAGKVNAHSRTGHLLIGRLTGPDLIEGRIVRPDGTRYEGLYVASNLGRKDGKEFRADGSLAEEGRFGPKGLELGKRYDAAGTITVVDTARDAELAAEAKQREAEAQRKREEEARLAEEQRKRDIAAAAARDFSANLQTMNPGQLFALADKLNSEGQTPQAREALRTLVSRFPNHALAAAAARQMASLAPAATAQADAPAGTPVANAGTGAGSTAAPAALRAPDDNSVDVTLVNRFENVTESKKLRVPMSAYYAYRNRKTGCQSKYDYIECMNGVQYEAGGLQNPFKLSPITTMLGGPSMLPQCKYTPQSYSIATIKTRPAEESCRQALQEAIHEDVGFKVQTIELIKSFGPVNPIPGTSTGNCRTDMNAYYRGSAEIAKRKPAMDQQANAVASAQLAMYLALNRIRILENSCRDKQEYEDIGSVRQTLGTTRIGCSFNRIDASQCVPRLPW
jgi:hypothetical protein